MRHLFARTIALLLSGFTIGPALADQIPDDLIRANLRSGWQTPQGTYMTALQLTMAPGWKTYWRAPGDAGIPPEFTWKGSDNIGAVAFHWPRPEVVVVGGYRTIAYS
ncbi:MAG: protein-disulfide reductase DsbD domain-containing protein, partial [Paracoccaceae bacterium]